MEKLIGFPPYYSYVNSVYVYPSNNILINQFMYGGLFAFIFFILIVVLAFYTFYKLYKRDIEDKVYKYMPLAFIFTYLVISLLVEANMPDTFIYNHLERIIPSFLSVFMYISLFILGHYFALINEKEGVQNEE